MQQYKSFMWNITGSQKTCSWSSTFKQSILTINQYKDSSFDRICKVKLSDENKNLIDKCMLERYRKYKCCVFIDSEYICNLNDTLTEYHYNDQKSYWKIVCTLIRGTKPSYSIPSLFQNETVAFTSEDKCDLLNDSFCSVTDLDNRKKDLPRFDDRNDATMTNVVVTEQDILNIIEVIDPKKASALDDFSPILLKTKTKKMEIIKPLLIIFNKSLELGQFPKQRKHAYVIPIFKKGDNFWPENYRPVSLLSCIGKVFERIVFQIYIQSSKCLWSIVRFACRIQARTLYSHTTHRDIPKCLSSSWK